MANTLAIRRRIKSAQNISKTTRAMQMIAASKLKRAQDAVTSSRPYVEKLVSLTQRAATSQNVSIGKDFLHPYMRIQKTSGKTLYIIIGPDKGLCGGLITNLLREYLKVRNDLSLFITVGKKIERPVASQKKNLIASFPFGSTLPGYAAVYPLIELIDENFLNGGVDEVKILTTHFTSVFLQTPRISLLLPVVLSNETGVEKVDTGSSLLFEPPPAILLPSLLKRYIEMQIFQHLLESYASFQAAQMIAMQNATDNAKDIVNGLRLLYNKARQERITNEILDISSATIALARA